MTFTWKNITNKGPCPRWGHSASIVKDDLFIFGGFSGFDYLNDLWKYSLSKKKWQ